MFPPRIIANCLSVSTEINIYYNREYADANDILLEGRYIKDTFNLSNFVRYKYATIMGIC